MNRHKLDILIENEVKQLTEQQISWLNDCMVRPFNKTVSAWITATWEFKDGVVNVDGGIVCVRQNLTSIPVQFGKVTENFTCADNNLTSLNGCTYEVGGNFICNDNPLTSLEYMPTKIGGFIYCYNNPFILNDKLFEDIKRIGGEKKIAPNSFIGKLKEQIPIQFGITDKKVINKIWQSYMNILEGKTSTL